MTTFQIGDMIYLLLLLLMLGGAFVVSNRASLGKLVQQALIWALIFLGVIAVIGLWDDIRSTVSMTQTVNSETGQIILPRNRNGHYHLLVEVNGTPVDFIVDTGASQIVLSREDAARVGFDVDQLAYVNIANTANGVVRTAPVRIDEMIVEDMRDTNVSAVVNEGELFTSLLGMSYLQRFSRVEISGNRLILTR